MHDTYESHEKSPSLNIVDGGITNNIFMRHHKIVPDNKTRSVVKTLEEYNDVWYVNFLRIDTFGKSCGTVNKKEQNSMKT